MSQRVKTYLQGVANKNYQEMLEKRKREQEREKKEIEKLRKKQEDKGEVK